MRHGVNMGKGNNLFLLTIYMVIASIAMSIVSPLIPNYILDSGYDMSILGLTSTISSLISALLLPFAGYFADTLGRRKVAIFTLTLRAFGTFMFYLGNTLFHIITAQVLIDLGFILSMPALRSMVGGAGDVRKVGAAFGSVMSIVSLIYTIFPSIGGLIYVYLDYSSTFLIASIIFLPALFPLALYEDVEIKKEGVRFDLKRILLPKKTELSVLIPFVLERISWGLWIFILNAIPNDLYGLGPEYLGLALSIQNSSWFISQYIFGRITDKVKPKYIYMFSNFVGIPMILLMLFVKDTRILLLTWALFGVSIASWIPSFNKLVFKITDIETRATTYGRIDSLRNLLGFPTPYIGGLMYVNIGLYAPLYTGMGLIAILMAIAYKLLPD